MNRLLIVDGSNLLFQMFFGMPSRIINKDGKAIQGTLGFVGALLKIIRLTHPTHIAVLFDGECKNERRELDSDYKANRIDYNQVPDEESPFTQLPDVYNALDFLNIPHAETENCEADDWISGYAEAYGSDTDIIISSFDSDFFQLISENVSVLRYRGEKTVICDCDYIKEKLGITPSQYADFKSLTGDTADNIKGAAKIGPKTAATLLHEYGNLENLLINAEKIQKPSVRASLLNSFDRLRKNYRLIKLDGKAPLPFPLAALKLPPIESTTTDVLRSIGVY